MNDRTPLKLVVIAALVAAAVYINFDFIQPGFTHPASLTRLLRWQSEIEDARGLELRQGLDLQGGLQVLLQVDREKSPQFTPDQLEVAKNIIQNRVNILGVTEAGVATQGTDKIVVELPGVADPALAVRTIGETALLEFIYGGDATTGGLAAGTEVVTTEPALYDDLAEDQQEPRLVDPDDLDALRGITATSQITPTSALTSTSGVTDTAASPITGTDSVTSTTETSPTFAVKVYPTVLTGARIQDARVAFDPVTGVSVGFTLDGEGGRLLQRFTSAHIDDFMPITLDKKVISSPTINAIIASEGQITGQFSEAEAQALVAQLRSGSLPVTLEIVGQTIIGPTLGRESVRHSVVGGLLGMAAVMLFMLLYYRVPGVLADLGLAVYALLTLAIFRLFPVTLTLAGIAGFVLSIGMAVDANILIFERMKEELRAGRTMRAAMDIGFRRAWPSIRDSNLSTLITCVILFWFGNQFGASIVKGFAVTLSLGVLTSLFTAITVTRTFLQVTNRIMLPRATAQPPLESPRLRALFGF
jgi:preprotein translocase subunit SecD